MYFNQQEGRAMMTILDTLYYAKRLGKSVDAILLEFARVEPSDDNIKKLNRKGTSLAIVSALRKVLNAKPERRQFIAEKEIINMKK